MIIEIDQTLHGYKNGHQLLASSKDLTPEEKRILLVQSDLSGSNAYGEFESYITGYPIVASNLYCFSKTWYAHEMQRPGCVWTHTLLIKFQDLGKVPEFEDFLPRFIRPAIDKYKSYARVIQFEIGFDLKINERLELKDSIVDQLYVNPDKALVVPTDASTKYESSILSIWSDQWPRLRRNFYFCSWALSLKSLNDKIFDLQIIPQRNQSLIERQSKQIITLNLNSKIGFFWKELSRFNKNDVRKFLWTYGSDIEGERRNYISLLQVFYSTRGTELDLTKLGKLVRSCFPKNEEAKLLKRNLFGVNSIIAQRISENEFLKFLTTEDDIDFLRLEDMDMNGRFINLILSRGVSNREILGLWISAIPGRLSKDALQSVEIDTPDLLEMLEDNLEILDVLGINISEICSDSQVWKKGSFNLQKELISSLNKTKSKIDWRSIINAILDANSKIIFEVRKALGGAVVATSLDWLVKPNNKWYFLEEWAKSIVKGDEHYFNEWLGANRSKINYKVFKMIFDFYDPLHLKNLDISGTVWSNAYRQFRTTETDSRLVYISCSLLSMGLNNKASGSQNLIAETFTDVYHFAADSKIDQSLWNWIPREDYEDEEDLFFDVFSFFGFDSKKKRGNIPSWDYCEILVRTLSNRFIKYSWTTQAFADALGDRDVFLRTLDYCLSFKKGEKFISKMIRDYQAGRIKLKPFQKVTLSKLL